MIPPGARWRPIRSLVRLTRPSGERYPLTRAQAKSVVARASKKPTPPSSPLSPSSSPLPYAKRSPKPPPTPSSKTSEHSLNAQSQSSKPSSKSPSRSSWKYSPTHWYSLLAPDSTIRAWVSLLRRAIPYMIASFLGCHVFVKYFFSLNATEGISMLPTIKSSGCWVIISKYYRRGREIQVGDLVSFMNPIIIGEDAIKRVVGLPGDFVLMNTPEQSEVMVQVPEGHCWLTGDNLLHSRDSRLYGPLPMALINGKITHQFTCWSIFTGIRDFTRIESGLRPAVEDRIDDTE